MLVEYPAAYNLAIIVVYAGLSTWALAVAAMFLIEWRTGMRSRYMLWGVIAFILLAIFFLFLSISGGSHPAVERRAMALLIRAVAFVVLVAGSMWVYFRARSHIVVEWRSKE